MKIKNKALSLLAIASMTSTLPLAAVMTSCSKYDMYAELQQDLLNQFYWICGHYRPTYGNITFCDDLCQKIEREFGFKVHKDDIFSDHKADPSIYDPGRYKPVDQESAWEYNYGYNFYFDIPSNIDDPNYPTIILQAHTDMVCTVATDIEYDWSNGTIPVIETIDGKKLMHSKDWKTSLGADDGIGLASILTIAKYQDKFQHGLIRCLFTVDEEDGESGAKYIDGRWLYDDNEKSFNFYLSLDGEILNTTWTSSGGASQVQWNYTDTGSIVTTDKQEMTIAIANFIGGHSALKLPDRRVSPTIFLGFVLEKLSESVTNLRLVNCFEGANKDDSPNAGTIPTKITFTIQGDTLPSKSEMKTIIQDLLKDLTKDDTYWFKGEADNLDKIFASLDDGITDPTSAQSTEGITVETTKNLITFLVGKCQDEKGNEIRSYQKYSLYGASKFLEGSLYPKDTYPEIGGNVGAIRLGSDVVGSKDPHKLHFDFMGRAAYQDDTRNELSAFLYDDWDVEHKTWKTDLTQFTTHYALASINAFGADASGYPKGEWIDAGYNLPWLRPEQGRDNFIKLIKEAATKTGTKIDEAPVFGWMEIGEIWQRTQKMGIKDIQYGSLGPTIHDVHTIVERLEVDSIIPMLKIALYVLKNLKSVN